jgi:hypothetical protein
MNKSRNSRAVVSLAFLPGLVLTGMASAQDLNFNASLSGDQEVVVDGDMVVPGGTDTDASGRITARFDRALTQVRVHLRIEGLTGAFFAAHFHCGRPGQNGDVVFGMVSPGMLEFDGERIRGTLTNADYTGADCTDEIGRPVNNLASLAFAMRDGLIYANVHSDLFPAGEIRGQMLAVKDN